MKNILLSIAGLILFNAQTLQAWPDHYYPNELSAFEIKSQGAGYISVSLDNRLFPNQTKLFSLSQVAPGNHHIEIFTDRIVYHGYYATTEHVRIFDGTVYIQPSSFIKGAVDHLGRFYIRDVDPLMNEYPPQQPHYYPYQPNYPSYEPSYGPVSMNNGDFGRLLQVVSDQWFEDSKLSVAMQALSTNYFTSDQVAAIMDKFWFEDSKLEFAKAAYPKVVDQSNYFIVNKEFWYSSSVEELNAYLSGH